MFKYQKSLFIFRRDLRLDDNTALIEAQKSSVKVIPCFIFDIRQIDKNKFKSDNCIQFMVESLIDLQNQLLDKGAKLYLFFGIAEKIIKKLIAQENIDAVFINADYTPFSINRDAKIELVCKSADINFNSYHDLLLNPPDNVLKPNNQPYTIFTPYFRKASKLKIKKPIKNRLKNFYTKPIKTAFEDLYKKINYEKNKFIHLHGGWAECRKLLKKLDLQKNYQKDRDILFKETTNLSAHNKFGTCSIREVFYAIVNKLGIHHPLIRSLYWRDFFTQIAYHFPHIFGSAFHKKFNQIKWKTNNKYFKAWCSGMTGFPVVDAGMRQLNQTGFMHNRARMIVASFLTKDLLIDWQAGEKYFAQKLVDYDPAVNNGNWQWSASVGCDAQPYFRIFNPWLQQKKFDPECLYIKKWIPELADLNPKEIHKWFDPKVKSSKSYPKPIVNHEIVSKYAKATFKSVS